MKLLLSCLVASICLVVLVSETESATTKAKAPQVTKPPSQSPKGNNNNGGNGANGMTTGSLYKWIGMFISTMCMLRHL